MKNIPWYKNILNYIGITIGTFIMAFAIKGFIEPNGFAPGGVTGIGIMTTKVTNGLIQIWLTNLLIDIPLFIAGVFIVGKAFGVKTFYGIIMLSFFMWIIPTTHATNDFLLASIFGGALMGLGSGIVFRSGGTTGGTDLAGVMLNKKFPHFNISTFMMMIDFTVIVMSGFVSMNLEIPLYSIITLYVTIKVIDIMLAGLSYSKAFFIISENSDKMGSMILNELERGVTVLKGRGFYSGNDKDIILCAVTRSQIYKLKKIVHSIDSNAFIIVTDINEVLGEGFKDFKIE
ncbi:hypothetical protein CLPU_4c02180 [Gottschalkia purinilytica]|uniref:DUF2179 domain-containing protein n=1 Tax=Gottschalkia purinilytica TaxID=1503 RepID=A0A0L0WCI0_GOTPU|nr:YitT family protein [Gottschalkia purinilytica]KNF09172.1 hypothetical protein CLPU_4c02180 [Gottschalkia purinilytica]